MVYTLIREKIYRGRLLLHLLKSAIPKNAYKSLPRRNIWKPILKKLTERLYNDDLIGAVKYLNTLESQYWGGIAESDLAYILLKKEFYFLIPFSGPFKCKEVYPPLSMQERDLEYQKKREREYDICKELLKKRFRHERCYHRKHINVIRFGNIGFSSDTQPVKPGGTIRFYFRDFCFYIPKELYMHVIEKHTVILNSCLTELKKKKRRYVEFNGYTYLVDCSTGEILLQTKKTSTMEKGIVKTRMECLRLGKADTTTGEIKTTYFLKGKERHELDKLSKALVTCGFWDLLDGTIQLPESWAYHLIRDEYLLKIREEEFKKNNKACHKTHKQRLEIMYRNLEYGLLKKREVSKTLLRTIKQGLQTYALIDWYATPKKKSPFEHPFYFIEVKATLGQHKFRLTHWQKEFIRKFKNKIGILILYLIISSSDDGVELKVRYLEPN